MTKPFWYLTFAIASGIIVPYAFLFAADWPQLQCDAQRHGYQNEAVSSYTGKSWVRGFEPERLHPCVQPVIVADRIYIGTEMGTLFCLNALDGKEIWRYPAAGSKRLAAIIGTAGVENGRLFFGTMDGCVYALATADAGLVWKFDSRRTDPDQCTGFSASVLLAENRLFIPNRGGRLYALDPATGTVVWRRDLGAPAMTTPCYDNEGGTGRVFIACGDMKVRAILTGNGQIAWEQAERCRGRAFPWYWTVAHKGYVFARPWTVGCGYPVASQSDEATWSMYAFEQATGRQVFFPHAVGVTMSGPVCPPCVDGDGMLVMPSSPDKWGRLNADTKTWVTTGIGSGGNGDESCSASAIGRMIFMLHIQEANANWSGCCNIDTKAEQDMRESYYAETYFLSNTQSGGVSPCAYSNKRAFHNTQSNLNCRSLH